MNVSLGNMTRAEVRRRLSELRGQSYIYILYRPCGTPFYVGKGINDRALCHERDAINTTLKSHKLNTIRALYAKDSSIFCRIEHMNSERDALARERELIAEIGRHDLGTGPLTNMTDGGEGPANFSEETRQRHRDTLAGVIDDGSPRSSVNAFFLRIGIKVGSVPIKPLGERRLEPLTSHPDPRNPTARQAAALAAVAIGNSAILSPGVLLNRIFDLGDGMAVLENGAGRDLLKSGMISLYDPRPGAEVIEVAHLGFQKTLQFVGERVLTEYGALMPTL